MLKTYLLLIVTLLMMTSKLISQSKHLPLSQNTNFYIDKVSNNNIYISSIDGLNIYDGYSNKVYRPDSTSNLYGRNIQSHFFEDSLERVWFTTYESLHFHDMCADTFGQIFLTDFDGNIIQEDYNVLGYLNDSTLVVLAGRAVFQYDVYNLHIITKQPIDLSTTYFEKLFKTSQGYNVYGTDLEKYRIFHFDKHFNYIHETILSIPGTSSLQVDPSAVLIGCRDGTIRSYDLEKKQLTILSKPSDFHILGLASTSSGMIHLSSTGGEHILFDHKSKKVVQKHLLGSTKGSNVNHGLCPINLSKDDNYWVSIDGVGINYGPGNITRFHNWPSNINAQSITAYEQGFIVTTRKTMLILLDSVGELVKSIKKLPLDQSNLTSNFAGLHNDYFYFSSDQKFYQLDLCTSHVSALSETPIYQAQQIYEKCYGIDQKSNSVVSYQLDHPTVRNRLLTGASISSYSLNSLKELDQQYLFLGDNDSRVLIFEIVKEDSLSQVRTLDLKGQIKFVTRVSPDEILLGTDYYVHLLDSAFNIKKQIIDDNGFLNGTVYGLLIDDHGNYWCSTNNGIIKHDPKTNHSHQFKMKDGLQGLEYNTDSYLKLDDGRMLFGGVNGINIFHPDSIVLSDYQTKVTISEFELMDQPSRVFGLPNYIQEMDLSYDQNYFDFTLVGTDYSSLEDVQLKYQLDGYDNGWQVRPNRHIAEYKQVPPGQYTFRVIASNSDGIWSEHERTIKITIHPPWWQTWWFRILAFISVGGLVLGGLRYYYNQQLKEKDYQLKAQQLTIEKQTVLEAERTRIAAEMHDDLGGGLTTIKFLSQKVLRKINDDTQKGQVEKILSNAQTLVGNMSEIIWAMNAGFDTLENLIAYSRRYAFEFLKDYPIELKFKTEGVIGNIPLRGEQRRNIFLITKEALHNVVKYSQASNVNITYFVDGDNLRLTIIDNGIGLSGANNEFGNGIKNMKKRVEKMGGAFSIVDKNGVQISADISIRSKD